MDESIQKWYLENFSDDPEGENINNTLTFAELAINIPKVYELLEVHDSIVRENVFTELANRLKLEYDQIYNVWLHND